MSSPQYDSKLLELKRKRYRDNGKAFKKDRLDMVILEDLASEIDGVLELFDRDITDPEFTNEEMIKKLRTAVFHLAHLQYSMLHKMKFPEETR